MLAVEDESTSALEAAVARVANAGLARWPGLFVENSALSRHLSHMPEFWATASRSLAAERYLALACLTRVPRAAELLRAEYGAAIAAGASSVDSSPAFVEDVMQQVLELLLVGTATVGPRVAQYKGRGPLGGWLRTTAKRVALRSATGSAVKRSTSDDVLAEELADACDQELALLRARYSDLFRQALTEALRELPARDRMLLRLNFLGGVSTTRIARMYHVNQSTISRQLRHAADKAFAGMKEKLLLNLGIVSDEVESLLAIVRSHIEMSLSGFEESASGVPIEPG